MKQLTCLIGHYRFTTIFHRIPRDFPGDVLGDLLGAEGPTVLPVATVRPVIATTHPPIISPNKPQCVVDARLSRQVSGGMGFIR